MSSSGRVLVVRSVESMEGVCWLSGWTVDDSVAMIIIIMCRVFFFLFRLCLQIY